MSSYKKKEKMIQGFMVVQFIIGICILIFIGILGYNILSNPEMVGEFFGRIMDGFEGSN